MQSIHIRILLLTFILRGKNKQTFTIGVSTVLQDGEIRSCSINTAIETGLKASLLLAFLRFFAASANYFYILWQCTYIMFILQCPRRAWRYQRGNQNPYIEEQTTQWPKEKVQKDKQRSTKHTHKTKDRVTRTPLKPGVNSGAPEWWAVPARNQLSNCQKRAETSVVQIFLMVFSCEVRTCTVAVSYHRSTWIRC